MFRKLITLLTGRWLYKLLIGLLLYATAMVLFAGTLAVFLYPGEASLLKGFVSLQQRGFEDPLSKARELHAAGRYCEALQHLEHYMDYEDVKNNPAAVALYKRIKADRNHWWTITENSLTGIWKGRGPCFETLLSATVADFFIIGDVRDFAGEGYKYVSGQEVDEFTVMLSTAGIALTLATYATGGAGAPVKGSVSLLKVANKMEKLPASLQRSLAGLLRQGLAARSWKPFEPAAQAIYALGKTKGLRVQDSVLVLSKSKNVREIRVMAKLAATYGKKTGKFLDLGGDSAIVIFKKFGTHKDVTRALDTAVRYGKDGTRLLEKTGPDAFFTYLRRSRYLVRGVRSWHEERLSELVKLSAIAGFFGVAQLLGWLSGWLQWAVLVVSGAVVVGFPARYGYRFVRRLRPA